MRQALAATAFLVLFCATCATVEKAPTDARLVEAQKAFDEGQRLQEAGQYVEAVPLVERALKLRKAVLGENHPDFAASLNSLANLYYDQGNYTQAEPLYERALAIREASLGNNHPLVAASLNNLANLYYDQGNYTQAEPLHERAL